MCVCKRERERECVSCLCVSAACVLARLCVLQADQLVVEVPEAHLATWLPALQAAASVGVGELLQLQAPLHVYVRSGHSLDALECREAQEEEEEEEEAWGFSRGGEEAWGLGA